MNKPLKRADIHQYIKQIRFQLGGGFPHEQPVAQRGVEQAFLENSFVADFLL